MIKGYLGNVCFNGELLKNHIIYTDSTKRIKKITPFCCESEGIILCDNILLIVKEEIVDKLQIKGLQEVYKNCDSYISFFKTEAYSKYGATDINGATFIELGDAKTIKKERDKALSSRLL